MGNPGAPCVNAVGECLQHGHAEIDMCMFLDGNRLGLLSYYRYLHTVHTLMLASANEVN